MSTVRPKAIVATSHPIEKYGGLELPEEAIEELAEALRTGQIPMTLHHDGSRPLPVSNVESGTQRSEDGYLQAWVEFDVDEALWNEYQNEVKAAGIEGFGGMSITFMTALDGEDEVDSPVKVAGDAAHFTDEELRQAAVILRALDPSAVGQQMYQLSAMSELRVVFSLALDVVMNIGLNVAASVIYDAAKGLFKIGQSNRVEIAFKESRRGSRSLKIAVKFTTEEELKIAMDRLPAVVESGARGTFVHHADGYAQVGEEAPPAIETVEGTVEIEGPDEDEDSPPAE